jgi:dihydrofolate reductase
MRSSVLGGTRKSVAMHKDAAMAKLLYSATMSLDGFIAGPGGDMQWLTPHLGPNELVDELVPQIGSLLVGRRTHEGDDPHRGDPDKEGAFEGTWEGPVFVLTRSPPAGEAPGVTFMDDLHAAVDAARAAAGDRYVNVLGASVARSCLEAGLLDEVLVLVAPVLLGDGVRLFEHPGGREIRLERMRAGDLWFRVAQPATASQRS